MAAPRLKCIRSAAYLRAREHAHEWEQKYSSDLTSSDFANVPFGSSRAAFPRSLKSAALPSRRVASGTPRRASFGMWSTFKNCRFGERAGAEWCTEGVLESSGSESELDGGGCMIADEANTGGRECSHSFSVQPLGYPHTPEPHRAR